jgi:N-methylhydantoinase B
VQPAGSGGYGDPALREPERVAADLADDYISEAAARRDYGYAAHGEHAELHETEVSLAAVVSAE